MFKWTKIGKVFNPKDFPGKPWMHEFAQAPCALVLSDTVRIYFSTRSIQDEDLQYISHSGYVDFSNDGQFRVLAVSEEPILPLGELGCFDEFGIYPVSVIKDGNQFKAYYAGWTRCESVPYNTAIGYATSIDGGKKFSRVGPGPLLSYSVHEPMTLSGPKIRRFQGKWYLFYVAGTKWIQGIDKPESVFKIRLAVSEDGLHWERKNCDIIQSRLDDDECQASPDVIYANGKYHMFFSYKYAYDFRNKERGYRIGYASSLDLHTWERSDDKAGIDVSSEGWDSEMLAYPNVFQLNGTFYMAYLGNGFGREGFGIAKLNGELL